jgi:hypothetical protein
VFTEILNHVQQGLARLVTQYQESPNIQKLLTAFIEQVQTIEDSLEDMNTARYIDDAIGQQLDNLGQIVGITRPPGASDAVYRNLILGQIKINTSQGQPEQVIQLFLLLTSAPFVILYEGYNADIVLESSYQIPNQAMADELITILSQATPAGVRIDDIVSFDPDMAFSYDGNLSGFGYDDGSQTVGGKYPFTWQFIGGGFAYDGDDPSGLGYGSLQDPLAGGAYLT